MTLFGTVLKLSLVIFPDVKFFNCVTIFPAVHSVLVLSILAVTLLNHVSIFIELRTVLVLFSLCKINTLVAVRTTLVARPLN